MSQRWITLLNMQSIRFVELLFSLGGRGDHLIIFIFCQVWVKPNGEMPFLYGNHVLKAHLGRITEDTPEHQGVVILNMKDIPLVCTWDCFHQCFLLIIPRALVLQHVRR